MRLSDWSSKMTSHSSRTCCHTTYRKVNIVFIFLTESWLLREFSKSGFEDKLKVYRQAGVGIYIIFACIVLGQTYAFFLLLLLLLLLFICRFFRKPMLIALSYIKKQNKKQTKQKKTKTKKNNNRIMISTLVWKEAGSSGYGTEWRTDGPSRI